MGDGQMAHGKEIATWPKAPSPMALPTARAARGSVAHPHRKRCSYLGVDAAGSEEDLEGEEEKEKEEESEEEKEEEGEEDKEEEGAVARVR